LNGLVGAWQFWALLAALFAALTAIFAKIGVENVDSDFATFIRTLVIVAMISAFLSITGKWQSLSGITSRTWLFLGLSGLATGASWLAYFRALQLGDAARVAPVDKLSVVLVAIFGVVLLGEHLSVMHWFGVFLIACGAIILSMN
jgi:transporter family protein